MLIPIRWSSLGAVMAVLAAGCSPAAVQKGHKDYDIVGKIIAVAADKSNVTIDHEAIPGLMKEMEMSFPLADANVVKGIQIGDAVKGKLRVQTGTYLVLSLEKTGAISGKAAKIQAAVAKLEGADRQLAESQRLCPVTGQPLGSMGTPTKVMVQGQPVFVCCDGCDEEALADPAKTLAKVDSYRAKTKDVPK